MHTADLARTLKLGTLRIHPNLPGFCFDLRSLSLYCVIRIIWYGLARNCAWIGVTLIMMQELSVDTCTSRFSVMFVPSAPVCFALGLLTLLRLGLVLLLYEEERKGT